SADRIPHYFIETKNNQFSETPTPAFNLKLPDPSILFDLLPSKDSCIWAPHPLEHVLEVPRRKTEAAHPRIEKNETHWYSSWIPRLPFSTASSVAELDEEETAGQDYT